MPTDLVYPSTLLLTSLLAIGFVFFVRASTKERLETKVWAIARPVTEVGDLLKQYFQQRGYRLHSVSSDGRQVTFQGTVAASRFLAALLFGLAVAGATCIALALTVLFPKGGILAFGLVGLAPVAPWFYWRGAQRVETVQLVLEPQPEHTQVTMSGHRDELIAFAKYLATLV
jgi:hypothetical protein